jgi:hypothetical protein
MGGGKAGWGLHEWVPLCYDCHELIDGRLGIASLARGAAYTDARRRLTLEADRYWDGLGGTT